MKIPEPETPDRYTLDDDRQWLTEWQEYEAELERMENEDERDE